MNPVILTSAYWPNVQYFTKLYAAPYVVMEHNDHYVKQTYRNRCIIEGPDGPLTLTVPVEHGGVAKPTTGEVRVSEHGNWWHLHWNALVSAYEKSPYFFYYADEFRPFYEQRFDRLVELNGAIVAKVCELLDLRPKIILAENYHQSADGEAGPAGTHTAQNRFPLRCRLYAQRILSGFPTETRLPAQSEYRRPPL